MNNPQPRGEGRGPAAAARPPAQGSDSAEARPPAAGRGGGLAKAPQAQAAAWASNPGNPPQYFDLPEKDGEMQPLVVARYLANSPIAMVDQYVPNLKRYHAVAMDVGLQDGLLKGNRDLDQALTRLGIAHTFETYEGNHTNRVQERFAAKVLPFFSANLASYGGK